MIIRRHYTVEESLTRASAAASAWETEYIHLTQEIEKMQALSLLQAQEIARLNVVARESQAHLGLLMDQTTEEEAE